jgi:hypothetical protein
MLEAEGSIEEMALAAAIDGNTLTLDVLSKNSHVRRNILRARALLRLSNGCGRPEASYPG